MILLISCRFLSFHFTVLYSPLSITADTLTYTITEGNLNNVFGIKQKTGDIYVAKELDYETPPTVRVATEQTSLKLKGLGEK